MEKRIIVSSSDPTKLGEKLRIGNWVYARTGGIFCPEISQAIGLEKDGEIVAATVYEGWNGSVVKGHIAIDSKYGMNKEFLKFNFKYVFDQLKARKLIGMVDSSNTEAMELDRNFGYVEEARIIDGTPTGDLVIFTMTREQCRFLR